MFDFDKIIEKVSSYTVNLYGQPFELKYRIQTYELLENQDTKFIKKLRDNGAIVITKRKMDVWTDKVYVKYYVLADDNIVPVEERMKVIEEVLNTKILCDGKFVAVQDFINEKWANNTDKKTTTELMDKESIILDFLASYIIAEDGEDANHVLSPEEMAAIEKKHVMDLKQIEDELGNRNWRKAKKDAPIHAVKQENIDESKPSWKKSSTFRMNNLYSFKNEKTGDYAIDIEREFNRESLEIRTWCRVDTNNEFVLNGKTYRLSKKLEQYSAIETDDDEDYRLEYRMDSVLILAVGDKVKYYDEDYNEIEAEFIERL